MKFIRCTAFNAIVLLLCAKTSAQAPEHPSQPQSLPELTIMPQDEDWSVFRDPALRQSPLDRIKYISLGRDGSYLSIGGEVREAYERVLNDNWSQLPYATNSFALQRYQLHFDVHVVPQLRFFIQLHNGLEEGRPGGPRRIDAKRLDFLNAFADIKPSEKPNYPILRIGKQELNYGSGRGVAVREGPNVRQGFYGFRVDESFGKWQSSAFAVRPAVDNFGFFNDIPDHTTQFWGVFGSRSWRRASNYEFDAYYFGLDRKNAVFNQGVGREVRHTFGSHIASEPPQDTGERKAIIHYDVEAVYQTGTFQGGNINAWTFSSDSGVVLARLPLKPRLSLRADITSGDGDPKAKNLQTFNALFPIGNYFGVFTDTGPGPANLRDLHPSLKVGLPHRVAVTGDWLIWWRDSLQDGVYGIPGNLLVAAGKSGAAYVGNRPGMEVYWQVDRHSYVQLDYGVFFAGPFLKESGNTKNLNFAAVTAGYRF